MMNTRTQESLAPEIQAPDRFPAIWKAAFLSMCVALGASLLAVLAGWTQPVEELSNLWFKDASLVQDLWIRWSLGGLP